MRDTESTEGLPLRLAVRPQSRLLRGIEADDDVRIVGKPGEAGGVTTVRGLEQDDEGMTTLQGPALAAQASGQLHPGLVRDLCSDEADGRIHGGRHEGDRLRVGLGTDERDGRATDGAMQAQAHGGDDAKGALGAAEERAEVVAGVVLEHAGQVREDGAVGEHGLDADDLQAGHAEGDDVDAPGVRGDGAADGRGVAGGEVDAVVPPGCCRVALHVSQQGSCPDGHLAGEVVDLAEEVEAAGREDDRQGIGVRRGNGAGDEAGVAALGHDGHAMVVARAQHGCDLHRRARAHDEGRRAAPAPRPVDDVLLHQGRIGEHVLGPDDRRERIRQRRRRPGVGHGAILTQRRTIRHTSIR